jgi:hypothetical protein
MDDLNPLYTEDQRERFDFLQRSYGEVRYNQKFTVHEEMVRQCHDLVGEFVAKATDACLGEIEEYNKAILVPEVSDALPEMENENDR